MRRAVAYLEIPLRRRDGSTAAVTLIDADDETGAAGLRWYLGSRGYAMRQYRDHRRILGLSRAGSLEADHINRDKLDNRGANLRALSHGENEQNKSGVRAKSGFRNVFYDKSRAMFFARVRVGGQQHVSKYFADPQAASTVAIQMRKELHPCAPLVI